MRFMNLMLGLALTAGLSAVAPVASFAQQPAQTPAPAAKAEAPKAFDESILDVQKGEAAEYYLDAMNKLAESFNEWAQNADEDAIQAILPKVQQAAQTIQKELAFAESDKPELLQYFQSYTMTLVREGNSAELLAIQKAEKSKAKPNAARVDWIDYLVFATTLDKAGEKGGDDFKKAILDLEKKAADKAVMKHLTEYVGIVANHDEAVGAALNQRLIAALAKIDGAAEIVAALKESDVALIGQEIKIEGVYSDKTELDWNDYKGKYVLVDFWATWCFWCIKEIPNNLEQYKKYHDAGFEILGISADDDLEALEKFEEENKHPWKSLSLKLTNEGAKADGSRYASLEKAFHVQGYPTMILIGPDGKIISMNARGEHLNELLAKIFPKVK